MWQLLIHYKYLNDNNVNSIIKVVKSHVSLLNVEVIRRMVLERAPGHEDQVKNQRCRQRHKREVLGHQEDAQRAFFSAPGNSSESPQLT